MKLRLSMNQQWSIGEIFLAAAVAAVVAVCVTFVSIPTKRAATADNWRRTADGWEQVGHWRSLEARQEGNPNSARRINPARNAPRLDTHPAVIALGQLVAVLFVLASFSGQNASFSKPLAAWKALISRSFRASVFGS